jgi:hypothetical protein
MLLGDLLSRFTDESIAAETIVGLGDLPLMARLSAQAEAEGLSLGAYAAGAMRRYASEASEEEWVTLMGMLRRAQDPGATCLHRALAHAVAESSQAQGAG